ncbi:glyoxalase I [Pyrrhoderma noxium]|uniref:Lactoylglutathione lyase n=1 Tax=Pyrrhoderma noxium TaxID=2282107 RepID=A0A286UFW2_9AGAM|nr:glyoxalase I [Pyrrhoderma noxium]
MARDAATASFKFNHTMLRVRDPEVSLKFYKEVLGMELLNKLEFSSFTLYFLAFDHSNGAESSETKAANRTNREGILELTHNHGTESDPEFKGYSNGNSDPGRGFGHIAISCDDINAACARFEQLGVNFQKRLTDGNMKNIAFIKDPDNYWIEIIPARPAPGEKV